MTKSKLKQMTIPIFIPHLGCGHSCTFCNQRTISGRGSELLTRDQMKDEIDAWLSRSKDHSHIEIGFFGGSFTGLEEQIQTMALALAKSYMDQGLIQGIRLSTRPDYLGPEVILRLKAYGVTLVEIGVQSFEETVLLKTKRGHLVTDIEPAVQRLKDAGIAVGIQLMIGLPGDTSEGFERTIDRTIDLKPSCVRLYPTLVLAHTELAEQYVQGAYVPLSLAQAVDMAERGYSRLIDENIPVIRMGLQSSEALSETSLCLAGPHHDAFRELVESQRYKRLMKRDLEQGLIHTNTSVKVNPKHVSFFSGQKRSNLLWLKEQGIEVNKIIPDESIGLYAIKWIGNNKA